MIPSTIEDYPMPVAMRHIDKIAREKQQDVLFLIFDPERTGNGQYEDMPIRQHLIAWFKQNNIEIELCGPMQRHFLVCPYEGSFYIDVLFDEKDEVYQKVQQYLEDSEGNIKVPFTQFHCLPLSIAMEDAFYDDRDFEP